MSWRSDSQKIIVHITDAPPHGDEYTKRLKVLDDFSGGCPCGFKIDRIAPLIREKGISYKLLKIGDKLSDMERIFKFHMGDNNFTSAPLASAKHILRHVLD